MTTTKLIKCLECDKQIIRGTLCTECFKKKWQKQYRKNHDSVYAKLLDEFFATDEEVMYIPFSREPGEANKIRSSLNGYRRRGFNIKIIRDSENDRFVVTKTVPEVFIVPKSMQDKMHKAASLSKQFSEIMEELYFYFEEKDYNTKYLEALQYGDDITDEFLKTLEGGKV